MDYSLIACDLDGTLFDSHGRLREENSIAINELSLLGVRFVPASGRTLSDIPEEVRNHPSVRYIIHSSGAVVYDKETDERISYCMPRELSHSVLKMLLSVESHVSVRRMGKTYVNKARFNKESFSEYNVWRVHADLLMKYAFPIDDFERTVLSYDNVEMIAAFFKNDDDLERIRAELTKDSRLNVVSASPHNLEIIYKEADKGRALLALADMLSIPQSATIAVGDSENDISMIKAAGLGLAMENAADKVKSCADETICHCDDHAVKFIKEKYILN